MKGPGDEHKSCQQRCSLQCLGVNAELGLILGRHEEPESRQHGLAVTVQGEDLQLSGSQVGKATLAHFEQHLSRSRWGTWSSCGFVKEETSMQVSARYFSTRMIKAHLGKPRKGANSESPRD